MNTVSANDTNYQVITFDEYRTFKDLFTTTMEDEADKGVFTYSNVAMYYYSKEYLGVNEILIAAADGRPTARITQAIKRMYQRSSDAGCAIEMMPAYRETIEMCDDLARDLGIKPAAGNKMKPFDREYRLWLVANEFGQASSYVDPEESVPYLANQILDSIEGMERVEAVKYISRNFGLYAL